MPWKETFALKERQKFILAAAEEDRPFSSLCDEFGISRKTGYKWLTRHESEGAGGLLDGRTKRAFPTVYDRDTREDVLELRQMKPTWGPEKLSAFLRSGFPEKNWPSPSTIKLWLREEGLSKPKKRTRGLKQGLIHGALREITRPNEVWCADFKGWFRTGDGKICEPLTILDGYSRYLLHCGILPSKRYTDLIEAFDAKFREYGRPVALRTDNGAPFGSSGLGRLSIFVVWLIKQGVWPEKTRPGHPEDNARQERFHRTLSEETASPPAKRLSAQQSKFDWFQREYNQHRPHEALGQKPPALFYAPGEYRLAPEYEYPEGMTVRRVNHKGYLKIGRRVIYVCKSLAKERIGLVKVDEDKYRVEFLGYPVGILTETYPLGCYL